MNQSRHGTESIRALGDVLGLTESRHAHEWVMSHVWISHVTSQSQFARWATSRDSRSRILLKSWQGESCHTYMRHITYDWVMSHMTQSDLAEGMAMWVMSRMHTSCHVWMSHATRYAVRFCCGHGKVSHVTHTSCHMNESCHTTP